MDVEAIRRLIVAGPLTDLVACRGELSAIQHVRGLLDAREMRVADRLDEIADVQPTVFPEEEIAAAAKSSVKKATRVRGRRRAADDVPQLGEALRSGDTTGERVDVVAAATEGLSDAEKARVAARGDEIARAAGSMSESAFRRFVEAIVRQARADDGLAKLQRQRAAVRLRWWTDPDGMLRFDGRFDPVSGVGTGIYGLPVETVRRWACCGTVTPVIVGADGVRLLLGREQRLANRAQRRALRALYRTCALCDTPFEFTQAHHVHWSTHGGPTDIDNLLPLCNRHHGLAHEGGWQLNLHPDRTLQVHRPDGAMTIHAPPRAMAA